MSTQRSSSAVKASRGAASKGGIISFDADRVVRGLVFHLMDDHYADRVAEGSTNSTRERMLKGGLHLAVARELWEAMSNRERFEWLLAHSRTQVVYSGRCAILTAER